MKRLIIDTDTGVDDAIALMIAFSRPEVKVEAITAVAGNVGLDRVMKNIPVVLDRIGAPDTPVYAGCASPLVIEPRSASYVHGEDGLGDTGFPPSKRALQDGHAALAIIRLANENPGQLTLLTLGPLTNVALAIRLDPDLVHKLAGIVTMGGAVKALGNVSVAAEFNVWADPEAAHVLFTSGAQPWLISWELTAENALSWDKYEELIGRDTPKSGFFRAITARMRKFLQEEFVFPGLTLPDPIAAAIAIEPEIVAGELFRHLRVETAQTYTQGQTVVDYMNIAGGQPNCHVVVEIDMEAFTAMLADSLSA